MHCSRCVCALAPAPAAALLQRQAAAEQLERNLPPPTRHDLQMMSVQQAVDAMGKFVTEPNVVQGACERWQSLGYGPGRRQSAFEAGALPAITAGMRAHPHHVGVQEKGSLAIANICSGVDAPGLERKHAAFEAGAIAAICDGMTALPEDAAVQSNGSAALGNICCGDGSDVGLTRKQAAFDAGAISLCVKAMVSFPDDEAVCENGAFAIGNLCRAPGKVGNSSTGDFAAPELQPIETQLKLKSEGQARKQAAADAGALAAIVAAMKKHDGVEGIQSWGARALSIVTYESPKLREEAKKAGAKMSWLMGLSDDMEAAQKSREIPMSKTGRPGMGGGGGGFNQSTGRPSMATGRPSMATGRPLRGY